MLLTLISGIAVGYSFGRLATAQQQVKQTMLLTLDLTTAPGKEAKMWITEIAPGGRTPKHYHPGDVVAFVLEGSVIHTVEGQNPVTLSAGQAFHEKGEVHWGANASPTAPVKFLTVQIADKGQPATIPLK